MKRGLTLEEMSKNLSKCLIKMSVLKKAFIFQNMITPATLRTINFITVDFVHLEATPSLLCRLFIQFYHKIKPASKS